MTLVGALLAILLVLMIAMCVVLGLIVLVCIISILWPWIGGFWNANVSPRGPPTTVRAVR